MFQRRGSKRLGVMSLSESEFYEAGMCLPPDVRKHLALRLLESVDSHGAFELASGTIESESVEISEEMKAVVRPSWRRTRRSV